MDFAPSTKSDAPPILKCSTTKQTPLEILRNASSAIVPKLREALVRGLDPGDVVDVGQDDLIQELSLLAVGGYNSIFLAKLRHGLHLENTETVPSDERGDRQHEPALTNRLVIRLPCEDTLVPYQVTNEVAFRRFVTSMLPRIPVPQVYLFEATEHYETSFIVEEFMDGAPLSSVWMSLTPTQKENVALKLSSIIVDLAEVRFDLIGGLDTQSFSPAPTVEGAKLFKGRSRFHRPECYPVGPYKSTKEYILACYDREIYYYVHGSEEEIDADLFADVSVEEFVHQLRKKREALSDTEIANEPFVLTHDDFHGRNILMRGDQLIAVLDWEFAGSYPLSETLSGGGLDVVEPETEELDEENAIWGRRIRDFVREEVQTRRWDQSSIDLLMGDGSYELSVARTEMFPS